MNERFSSILHKVFTLKRIIILAVNILCIAAFFTCLAVSSAIRSPMLSQQAAPAWAGQSGERFSQLSVFFPGSSTFNEDSIRNLYATLDIKLRDASMESRPGRILYTDAWSTSGDVSLATQRGTASAKAIAVGGNFFLFHPFILKDGSYISPDDIMNDRIVIDEDLAWRMFGAVRVSGFEILINNLPFKVAGVISREKDFANTAAYTDGAGLFMSFDAYKSLMGEYAGVKIDCYEIVLPDPITGFAVSTLTGAITDPGVHIVENTTRFSLENSFTHIRSFGERGMRANAIAFPYWENAARLAEDWLALLLALSLLFIIFPIICTIIYSVILIRLLIKFGKTYIKKLIDKKDKREYEKYLLRHNEAPQIYDIEDIIREVKDETF